ncbi:MAG: hypothetical protein N3C12_02695 [Candidatus Binatia bacterium]|nr:hypothetical protein [Candidatus Binatia bacterium]
MRSQWGPLFESYGVDVVFTGHDDTYERSKYWDEFLPDGSPGHDGRGAIYIMTGGAERLWIPLPMSTPTDQADSPCSAAKPTALGPRPKRPGGTFELL